MLNNMLQTLRYKNKYRVSSARLRGYDYSQNGFYFITICAKNRIECFGKVRKNEMILSPLGCTADECWRAIPNHFPFVRLDAYIVMPNHAHGILEICNDKNDDATHRRDAKFCVSTVHTTHANHVNDMDEPYKNKFGPQSKNISSIIRGFKMGVTKYARQNHIPFAWQERFYDHIIRKEIVLHKIRQYIIENPSKWWRDRNNQVNIYM